MPGAWFEVLKTVYASEVWGNHGDWITSTKPAFGPGAKERIVWASTPTSSSIAAAKVRRAEIRAHVDPQLLPGEVLCLPTSPRGAPLLGSPIDKLEVEYREQAIRLFCIAGMNCCPMARIDSSPLGISLARRRGRDFSVLALGRRLMSGRPTTE